MSEPRFYVHESRGYLIGADGTSGRATTLISVYDSAYMHREVARFGTSRAAWTEGYKDLAASRKQAARRCAELNAWNEQESAS